MEELYIYISIDIDIDMDAHISFKRESEEKFGLEWFSMKERKLLNDFAG